MNSTAKRHAWIPWMMLILLWESAFALACFIDAHPTHLKSADASMLDRILGASRVAFGNQFYIEADRYFHMGVGHVHERAFTGVFEKWADTLSPNIHIHPKGVDVNEILPWLRFSTAMNPHHIEAYLNAAFWLADQGERPDLAEKVLFEAQQNNPTDYRIYQQKGQLYMAEQQVERATRTLDIGIRLWPSTQDPRDEQSRLDLAQMLTYRAFLYELKGEKEQALELFKRAHIFAPHNRGLAIQIEKLTHGEDIGQAAETAWKELFPRKQICSREGEDRDHEHELGTVHDDESHHNDNHDN